jgi:site-specific recombinase XerD
MSNSSPPISATPTHGAPYARACSRFFAWCDGRGLTLTTIRPHDVATYIEERQATHSAPDVKQQLAAVRMMFDWLIVGQVAPSNPTSAVRGPKHVVKTGKTPVLDGKEWRKLIDTIPADTVRDLRDRALIALEDEGRGPAIERFGLADPAARERRQAAHDALPSRAR